MEALAIDFDAHGREVIQKVRADRPADYLKIVAALVPKQMEIEDPALDKRQRERKAFCFSAAIPHARRQSGQSPIHSRQDGAGRSFRSELLSFPAGKHDDQVDALGLVGQLLDQMVAGQAPKKSTPPKIDTGYKTYSFSRPLDDWIMY